MLRWIAPSASTVTRLSGCGRSSPQSQKSTAWCARTSNGQVRREPAGPSRRLCADLLVVGLAEHLDAAERVVPVVGAQVPVVHRQRLLESRGVGLLGDGHQGDVVVPHVVPADHSGAVGQPVRVAVAARPQQQRGRVHRAAGDHHDVAGEGGLGSVVQNGDDPGDAASGGVGLQALHIGAGDQRDVVLGQHRIHADDLRVRLRVQQAREAIDPVAADAGAGPCRPARLGLLEVDSDGQVEGVQPELLQVVAQLLDAGFVGHRREGVLLAGMALGRVLAVLAVDQVEVLRLGVVGLQVVVRDRPGR